jgi:N-hydroxyarylamine O-acetyltransferase
MQAANFSLDDYFDRIGFDGPARADLATVTALMERQLFTVPFENLDVQAGKAVSLVPEEIVDKLVKRRRGGYCYEVNGLFAMALHALGIEYQMVAARPMIYPARRPRTHMALVARLDGREWLCDLGFGSYGPRAPLALDAVGQPVTQGYDTFRLITEGAHDLLLQAQVEGAWANQYAFTLCPQEWVDFAPANYLNSTHPDALFVQKLIAVIHRPEGRVILFGDQLKELRRGVAHKRVVEAAAIPSVLKEHFGL